jgi:galactonate dehydratase
MNITKLETFLTNSGLRNYLFIRLTTDTGLTGLGEASLEWQEKTVDTVVHEWVLDKVIGADPFDIERVISGMVRDQYQGGSTIMTAISGIELAFWDIIGKSCGQPVYKLLGGRCKETLSAYANGWYGGARTAKEYAQKAVQTVNRGYRGIKFDPFGTAWKELTKQEMKDAESLVSAVRSAIGDDIEIMIEVHGRLSVSCAIEMAYRLEKYHPCWYEEPTTPPSVDLVKSVKEKIRIPVAAGERLYTQQDFYRLIQIRACDIVQPDIAHCGGLSATKKIAAMAEAQDINLSPHCSIGPVALCAAVHFGWSTPNVIIQENFGEYDVPWRNDYVNGAVFIKNGNFLLPDKPGLGIELNTSVCAKHPYKKNSFPSLWDRKWFKDFTQKDKKK